MDGIFKFSDKFVSEKASKLVNILVNLWTKV